MEIQQFYIALKNYNENKKDEHGVLDASYKLFFCSPAKKTERRMFQVSWNKHPIGAWFAAIAKDSPHNF